MAGGDGRSQQLLVGVIKQAALLMDPCEQLWVGAGSRVRAGGIDGAAVVLSSGSVCSSTPPSKICWVVKSHSLLFACFEIVFLFWLASGFTFILNFIVCLFFVLEKFQVRINFTKGSQGSSRGSAWAQNAAASRAPGMWGGVGRVHGCRSTRSPSG